MTTTLKIEPARFFFIPLSLPNRVCLLVGCFVFVHINWINSMTIAQLTNHKLQMSRDLSSSRDDVVDPYGTTMDVIDATMDVVAESSDTQNTRQTQKTCMRWLITIIGSVTLLGFAFLEIYKGTR